MKNDQINAESDEGAQQVGKVVGIDDDHCQKAAEEDRQDTHDPVFPHRKKCMQNPEKHENIKPFQNEGKNIKKLYHSISPQ